MPTRDESRSGIAGVHPGDVNTLSGARRTS